MKVLHKENGSLQLLVKGTDTTFINSIRRAVMNAVPTLAISEVTIYENSSVIVDEFFTHRLGLIPIKADLKKYKIGEKVKFVLEKDGPCTVYSKDIKSTDPKIDVVNKHIPLLKLKKGQKIKLEMDAVVSTGKEHSRFQPAIVGYRNLPVITVDKSCTNPKEVINVCPVNVLEMKAGKVVLADAIGCIVCGKCRDVAQPTGTVKLEYDENTFIVEVESHHTMETKDILLKATEKLGEKSNEFLKEIKKL